MLGSKFGIFTRLLFGRCRSQSQSAQAGRLVAVSRPVRKPGTFTTACLSTQKKTVEAAFLFSSPSADSWLRCVILVILLAPSSHLFNINHPIRHHLFC